MRRLKNRAQFQAVLAGSTIARSGHFALHRLHLLPDSQATESEQGQAHGVSRPLFIEPGIWMGAMVPKRWAKRAVTRNMIKRKIYSLAALAQPKALEPSSTLAFVIRLRSAFDPQVFKSATSTQLKSAVSQELSDLFAKGFQSA